jgi:phosphoribosylaminoimidazolecarboxamide formyltransferase / IMP cyclohydrolase
MTVVRVRRALVSVSDKAGLEPFVRRLVATGIDVVSSGGTARALEEAGIPVTSVAEVTGAPEMLGGRVKTLHPRIHGGILADLGNDEHRADLAGQGIEPFQLVVVNLYPFRETVAREGVTDVDAVEQIDIGGPAMVRAAAKNHAWVGVVTSPDQYEEVAAAIESGGLDHDLRRRLARAAFFHTASYDAAVVGWLEGGEALPERLVIPLERTDLLRYGENPHQPAAAYRNPDRPSWWEGARQVQGKAMSFNNYLDADAAWRQVQEFADPACVIVKHTNACGVAEASEPAEAFRRAWDCDPMSAFGSVIALNRPLDAATAEAMSAAGFVEVVVAPAVEEVGPLGSKPNLRILAALPPRRAGLELRPVDGGFVAQGWDRVEPDRDWRVVSARAPTGGEWADLRFAWKVVAHTKSNAIVIAGGRRAVGIGAGDQARVGAAERAVVKAGERARGGVAASDAFLPFRDGLDTLAAAGVTAVIEPGGSVRDDEVVKAADEHGIALVFTGRRHFRH